MTRKTKVVTLSEPWMFVEAGKRFDHVVLVEPSAELYFKLGPLSANYIKNGIVVTNVIEGVLESYLAHCAKNVDSATLLVMLRELPLVDAVKIQRAFASFFDDAITVALEDEAAAIAAALGQAAATALGTAAVPAVA